MLYGQRNGPRFFNYKSKYKDWSQSEVSKATYFLQTKIFSFLHLRPKRRYNKLFSNLLTQQRCSRRGFKCVTPLEWTLKHNNGICERISFPSPARSAPTPRHIVFTCRGQTQNGTMFWTLSDVAQCGCAYHPVCDSVGTGVDTSLPPLLLDSPVYACF